MKTFLTATALSLSLAGMALAQTAPATDPAQPVTPEVVPTPEVAPEAQTETMPEAPAETMPEAQATTPDAAAPAAPATDLAVLTEAELVGTRVHGIDGADLGEVSAVTVDGVGKVTGVVVDVGGFLGIGEKPVALSADQITVTTPPEGGKIILSVSMTEDQLKALPEHQG